MQYSLDFLLWGSSGHGKVLRDLIELRGGRVQALVDNNPLVQTCVDGIVVHCGEVGLRKAISDGLVRGISQAAVAIGGARGTDRRTIADLLRKMGFSLPPLIHPTAAISTTASIAEGCHVLANTVVGAEAQIGPMCIINNGSVVDHECIIEKGAHVAPGATLCGCIIVEQDAMIGAGATILPRVRIGQRSIVGAGATVTRDVPADTVVVGNPARARGRIPS